MQRGFAAVPLLLVLILVGLVGVGVYIQKDKLFSSSKTEVKTVSQEVKKATPELVKNIFSNKQLGFEFEVPKGLSAQEDTEEEYNKRGNGNFRKNFSGYVSYEPEKFLGAVSLLDGEKNFDKSIFTVWVFDNDGNLSLDKWYDKYWYYPFVWGDFTYNGKFAIAPKNEATVGGLIAKEGVVEYSPGKPKFYYLSDKGKMFLIRIMGEGDKILDSFKFTQ